MALESTQIPVSSLRNFPQNVGIYPKKIRRSEKTMDLIIEQKRYRMGDIL